MKEMRILREGSQPPADRITGLSFTLLSCQERRTQKKVSYISRMHRRNEIICGNKEERSIYLFITHIQGKVPPPPLFNIFNLFCLKTFLNTN